MIQLTMSGVLDLKGVTLRLVTSTDQPDTAKCAQHASSRLLTVLCAGLVAAPLALALAGVLLPGDPDDPNTKVFLLGMVALVPSWAAAVGCYALASRTSAPIGVGQGRIGLYVAILVPGAVGLLLLVMSWPVAMSTPVAETAEQAMTGPYLWREGAYRMGATALFLLAMTTLLLLSMSVERSRASRRQ